MSLLPRRRRRGDADRGATAVEYALMVSLIALVIVAAVIVLGTSLSSLFQAAATSI